MLVIIPTPLGNLEDISIRQLKSIYRADLLLAEDTRVARNLIAKLAPYAISLDIKLKPDQKIISYFEGNEKKRLNQIFEALDNNKTVGLISEAGSPAINDPGQILIREVINQNLNIDILPGPSAVTTSLLYHPNKFKQFMFIGFLPKGQDRVKKTLDKLQEISKIFKHTSFVAFESPHRIIKTLEAIESTEQWNLTLARELSKLHQEILQSNTDQSIPAKQYKGEICLVLSPKS
ncbi:16S rRNA (cytidine(1402)-2'-O)-methyltransferase [Candidatus Saccharibacteria bacterium]|nr:16S rRNA (cytidine(1402)-2'-O)-methyltransferase [Candidatus Saccharibacteria bacterium]